MATADLAVPPADGLRRDFLQAMSLAACTVAVVTTDGPAGRFGVTVSAMSSVSADGPAPTLLVCVHHLSPAAAAILANGAFCVNVLRDDQSAVSDAFAGRGPVPGGDKFAAAAWTPGAVGAPRIAGALAWFDCRLAAGERVGTHHVLFGAVAAIGTAGPGAPLLYANRGYGTPVPLPQTALGA
ncbi:flavin reductase family protein [Oharaeibacter diazotrophicus]|uniref:Flavin reductase n=2 Tax=Oharaeibacter diazotrophicus TaxID=1920512 RepID=A0A4R6RKW3_9HYPH|nr:flavin reductase family protein [Oharaeibacter diazotrophicus]TDP87150.1 flavin reductase [Oharaeibacter diazotrophicus]BBE70907.1 FMN reductase (NADH) RutF [Pleomorphomonas sp. SM30]GLS77656.1 FMN reductase (NADH) RutF [Oharaeibacter diazotrophicus]